MKSEESSGAGHRSMARRLSGPEMHGISRDNRPSKPSDAGWRVRLVKQEQFVADRHFRDLAYGGRTRAMMAARCYRDDMAKEHGIQLPALVKSPLAEERQSARLTQAAVAMMLGVSPGLIAKWEREDNLSAAARSLYQAAVAGTVPTGPTLLAGHDVRRIRADILCWTQSQLADALGCSYAAIGYWERGQRRAPGWVLVYLNAVNEGWVGWRRVE